MFFTENAKWIPQDNLHLTVLYIGFVSPKQLSQIKVNAKSIRIPPLDVQLNLVSMFKRASILWLGSDNPNEALVELNSTVKKFCDPIVELKKEKFIPHVTLARKFSSKKSQCQIDPILWSVNRVYLMESVPTSVGVNYKVLQDYTLS